MNQHDIEIIPHFRVIQMTAAGIDSRADLLLVFDGDAGGSVQNLLGNTETDICALPRFTGDLHKAAHGVDKTVDYGEAEAKASDGMLLPSAGLVELFGQPVDLILFDPYPGIAYRDTEVYTVSFFTGIDVYIDAALFGKFQGISDQMTQYLTDLSAVSFHLQRDIRRDIKNYDLIFFPGKDPAFVLKVIENGKKHIGFFVQTEGSRMYFGIIKDIADLFMETEACLADRVDLVSEFLLDPGA
jgi:hypothetical protein